MVSKNKDEHCLCKQIGHGLLRMALKGLLESHIEARTLHASDGSPQLWHVNGVVVTAGNIHCRI